MADHYPGGLDLNPFSERLERFAPGEGGKTPLEPEGAGMTPDEKIKKDIVDALVYDYEVDATDIVVDVENGDVTLGGTVPGFSGLQAATADAWSAAGVKRVTNVLSVEFPSEYEVPVDAEIAEEVGNALAWNADIHSIDIDVSVNGGVVRLDGTVDAYWKRNKASELASQIRGVTGVENHLNVIPTDEVLDKDIADDIERALERDMYVDAEQVTVEVQRGQVVLTGSVTTPHARGRAYDAACAAPGVVKVDNRLTVMV